MIHSTTMPVPIARNLPRVVDALRGATAGPRRPGWCGPTDFSAVCASLYEAAEHLPAVADQIRETVLEHRAAVEDQGPMASRQFRESVVLADELAMARTVAELLRDTLRRADRAARALANAS